jgi:hypothetical protein
MRYKYFLIGTVFVSLVVPSAAYALKVPPWYKCRQVKHTCNAVCVDTHTGRQVDIRKLYC